MKKMDKINKMKIKVCIAVITMVMVIGQLPTDAFVHAQANNMFNVQLSDGDIYSQQIKVKEIEADITKVALQLDGKTIETKDVSAELSFDVYSNGTYEIVGYDANGTQKSEESIKVDSFEDLTIEEDKTSHQVKIVSRYHLTEKIKINNKDSVDAIETQTGYYEAYYDLPKNGDYTFSVLNFDGKELASKTLTFTDVPNINKAGEIILSSETDIQQIISNPSGNFILDADIVLTSDLLKDVNFTGTLDGKGYTISGITDRLFKNISNATFKNIVIEGKLAETSVNSTITDTGFYVEASDSEKDYAIIMNSENTTINNSFAFMNVEGKIVSSFIMEGTGTITNSYVSGYLSGKEVYGFGKKADIKNSYITASLVGDKRTLFSDGDRIDCFYDAQINDLDDNKATPYYTLDMISGKLNNEAFTETEGTYPTLKNSKDFKEKAQDVSALSVLSVKTKSNLSALEGTVETGNAENIEGIDWDKSKDEITAESNEIINRFALKEVKSVDTITAGTSTDAKTTQVTFPMTMGKYYMVVKSSETAPTLPASHKVAIESGWKIMYWSGSYKQSGLEWNTEYKVYSTDLETVSTDGTIKTEYGKNGGKVSLTGTYDVNQTMTATLSDTNTTKGTMIWETADTLNKDAVWTAVQTTAIDSATDTYKVQNSESSKYLRARFVADETTGYKGTLTVSTDSIIKQAISEVTIENKTNSDGTYTFNDKLIANMKPAGKENEVTFQWFYEGENADTPIATGRNYQIKGDDVGKKLYVKAVAKNDGDFKDSQNSSSTSEILAIQCDKPVATDNLKKVSIDDITVTLSMNTDSGLYRYGYKTNLSDEITPYSVLSRNKTNTTITGLSAHTTYYFYVQQVGENGYSDSAWSDDYLEVKTDNDHVKGDVMISGNTIYKQKLTTSITNNPSAQTGQFVWYRLDKDGKREATPLATNTNEYTLTKEDIKFKIEVVYEGTGDYSGEISTITDSIDKEEKSAPTENLTVTTHDDTTIKVKLPTNTDGEKYIIGISGTQQGVPIEQLDDDHKLLTFSSGDTYTITGLSRDTDYYLSIRYAENDTHQKSDWIKTEKAVNQKTDKKTFTGKIEFTYDTNQISVMQGRTINAELIPDDTSFNNKGTWTWTRVGKDGKTEVINNFTMTTFENGHTGTSYVVPDSEEIGTTYKVTFEANVGYEGSINGTSEEVIKQEKTQYKTPNANHITMEFIDDTSIKVKMSEGDGQYRFWYKKADQNAWDSFVGLLNKTFSDPDDGYKVIDKNVFANVDVVIDGLDRNTEYIVRVERVEDDNGSASEFAYSADKTADKFVITKKTEIAGYTSITGTTRYNETLTATYNPATYASTGTGSDEDGTWQWYRGNTKIDGATADTYTLVKADIGQTISVKYTIPDNNDFEGEVEAKTAEIKKAVCISPEIKGITDKENASGKMSMIITGTASANEEHIYYRVQTSDAVAPSKFPTDEEIARDWKPVESTTITVDKDVNNFDLVPNTNYSIYFIKTETETEESSSILSKQHKMGTYKQAGTITFEKASDGKEAFVSGQTVKATMKDSNNQKGTWKWYMSTSTYDGTTTTSMPSVDAKEDWEEITSGFSPILDGTYSELSLTDDMFAHYIRAEFVANEEYNYSGAVSSTEAQFVKKVYEETLTITSSTKDGNKNPKAYMNTVITGTINNYAEKGNVNRDTVQFKIGDIIIKEGITISRGKFTYTMPKNQSYDGKEITAEVSTPKIIELFVDSDLKPIATQTINSKISTKTSFGYTYGIPISSAEDFVAFMDASQKDTYKNGMYASNTADYIITENINLDTYNAVSTNLLRGFNTNGRFVYEAFHGTLNGDFHSVSNLKNMMIFFAISNSSSDYVVIENMILNNAQIITTESTSSTDAYNSAGIIIANSTGKIGFENVFLIDSKLTASYDCGYFIGRATDFQNNTTSYFKNCGSVGGSVVGSRVAGGIGGNIGSASIYDCFTIGTTLKGGSVSSSLGATTVNVTTAKNFFTANIFASSVRNSPFGTATLSTQSQNFFYDKTLLNNVTTSELDRGRTTENLIGDCLKDSFGDTGLWKYANGFYPRLTWMRNNSIANLYAATRGAFTSVDNQTTFDELFNGNISGTIQIPTELQTSDYSVKSSNESILKVTDSGTIIPVGTVGQKATITITYTEPDEAIGGSASNTYDFTITKQVKAMDNFNITDTDGTAYTSSDKTADLPNPQMKQTLKANSTQGTKYQWYRRKSGTTESEAIQDATKQTYTLTSSDVGYELCVLVDADEYAATYSSYTKAVVSIQPDGPTVSDITDSSVKLKATNGNDSFKYEFGYMRNDLNAMITQVDGTYTKDELVEIKNLQRNKKYDFYVRIAKATDGSYDASDWSLVTSETTLKTKVTGTPKLGTGINNGKDLTLKMEATNGQTGTWSLKRVSDDGTEKDITTFTSDNNDASYTLTGDDVKKRIKAVFTGRGDFEGTVESAVSDVVQKETKDKPESPVNVKETDTTITIKMEKAGTYDIGYSDSTSGEKTIVKEKVAEGTEVSIIKLKRNTDYYIYARYSETDATATSSWSPSLNVKTAQTVITGNISELGIKVVDGTVIFMTPTIENLTGTWKLERVIGSGDNETATTISPSNYKINNNTISYVVDPKDAGNKLKVTFTGNGDFKDSITYTTDKVTNASQDITDMPTGATVSSLKDYSFNIQANDGTSTYQFGYALKGQAQSTIKTVEATGTAKTNIAITELTRNTEYDIYVRKAAQTGYDAGAWKLITTQKTDKSTLTGTVEYVILDGTTEKPAKVGVADVGVTYKAKYLKGTYAQPVDETSSGHWQWYANNEEIENATTDTYKIQPMEGDVEITVKYITNDDSDFKDARTASVGTLTKPAYDAPTKLPTVTALAEDGKIGSRLQITNTEIDDVFYYVKKSSDATVPTTITSSLAEKNEVKANQWFKATEDMTLSGLDANSEYVVYVARLEDGEHQSSGVISQRAVKTVKENLSTITDISIKEKDDTKWKILQNKELRISNNNKSIDGVWQYYVTQNKADDSTWQNITSEVKVNTEEGTTDSYSYTLVNVPLKYANGFYIKAVFTGRGDYEGSQSYVSTETIIGTQIKGSAEISTGDSSQVFVPITVNYVYAKDADGKDIKDEANGIWTWYRETADGFEKIPREKDTVGISDSYIPTSDDVGKKLYAVYTGAPTGIYSGKVESSQISYIKRAEQTTPEAITVKQVNGTNVQINLPTNMDTRGKTIAQARLEYTIKDKNDWQKNGAGDAWINDLKANTEYEVRVRFEGTSEYEPSAYGDVITVKTGNQSFDEDNLSISVLNTNDNDVFETGSQVTATFTGSGYDEGYFNIKRSDGTLIQEKVDGTSTKKSLFRSGTNTIAYTITSADIGSNIVIEYQAKDNASTYGGSIEKSTIEVAKPVNPTKAGTPVLETIEYSETTLKVKVNDANEYVFNESATEISETSGDWKKLEADSEGYYTFTGLDKAKSYYQHVRTAETVNYRYSEEDVSAATKPWSSTRYDIHYENIEGATNGNPVNPTQYTELSNEITLNDASKTGYTFKGWTTDGVTTPTKGLTIPTHSSGDKTFTAVWEIIPYTMTYDLKGGTLESGITNPAKYNVETADFTLNNPIRAGYTFKGWTKEGEADKKESVTILKGTIGNLKYTANWEVIPYTITYNLDDGTNGAGNPTTYTVESEAITLSAPTKKGYTFVGWSGTDITGTSQDVTIAKGSLGNRTYNAVWTPTEYSLSYDLDGGEVTADNKDKYTIESDTFTLTNPTKNGYVFDGWTGTDITGASKEVKIEKGSTGTRNYKATWLEEEYTIAYVLGGGDNNSDNPSTYTITTPKITLKAPTRNGYIFKGWKLNGTGTAQETVVIEKGSTGNLSYSATWEKVEYTVLFDSNEGSAVSQAGVKFEEKITKPDDPTKEGYTFKGWFKEEALENEWKFETDVVTDNITLYAKWTINEYTASFDGNGGDSVTPASIKKNYQEKLGTLPTAEKTGYTLEGWYTAKTGGDKITANTVMSSKDITYYAHWTINEYTASFDANGGDSVSPASIKKNYQEKLGTLPTAEKIGYTFDGWYTAKTGGDKITTETTMPADGAIYYAHWTVNQYTASFDGNEGTDGTSITKDYDTALEILPTSSRSGYKFLGWFTEKVNGVQITSISKMPAKNVTYYAHWEIKTYDITYDLKDEDAVNDETNAKTYTVEDADISLHAPTWTGHTFLGWSYEGMTDPSKPELEVTIKSGSTGDKKFTANWKLSEYTVKFDSQDGSEVADMGATHGVAIVKPVDPTKTGYTFKGWYTDEAYSKEWNFDDTVKGNMTLYAKWEINHYEITFQTNSGSSVDKQIIDHGQKVVKPTDPTRDYYVFAGWYSDDKLTKEYDFNKAVESKMTLYAKWTPVKYTMTYVLDGGDNDAKNPETYTVEDEITLKAPTKENYTFKGWTYDGQDTPTKDVTIPVGEHGNKTYTAHWEINHYDVTFDTNGGGTINKQTIDHGSKATKPTDPTKVGYTFAGWYSDDKLTKEYDFSKAVESKMTLYAKWTVNKYTAKFDGNGGTDGANINADYNTKLGTLPTSTLAGYTFDGWFTEADGGTAITENTLMPLDGATYYAHWTINQYTAKFDGNGGSNGTDIKVDFNTKLGTLPISTKTGYTFNGWYTEKTGGTKIDENTLMPLNGVTYYAQWTINSYTATFKSSDDEADDKTITKNYDAELEYLPVATKTGYDFTGWYTAKVDGTKINENTKMPAGDVTYYAQWKVHTYAIAYDLNDEGTKKAVNDPANKTSYTIEDETFTLKAPSWSAHVFTGWTWTGHDTPEMNVEITKGTTGDKSYKANWVKSTYTVTFDSQGGSQVEEQGAEHDGLVPEPSAPTKEGYTFKGWFKEDTFKNEWKFDADKVTSSITLYAKWEVNAYTATFDVNGGDTVTPETMKKNYEEALGELPTAIRKGYTFKGWYTAKTDGEEITKETTMPSKNITYYAQWKINSYTAIFKSSDDAADDKTIKKDYDAELGELPVVTKEGYDFLGWFSAETGGDQISKTTKMPENGATYYAQWKIKEYTVTFKTNGGTAIKKITVEHGKAIKMPENPNKDMYNFVGWYSDADFKKEWKSDDVVTADMTLYAKYEAVVAGNAEVEVDKDSPIELVNKKDEVIEAVLSNEEYRDYLYGKDVRVRIACEEVKSDERDIIKNALDGRTAAKYFDITIYKTIGEDEEVQVDKLRKTIKIVLDIPEELYPTEGITRVFDVIRIHKEKAEILSDLDKDEKTVTIESDEFSTYILCYKDTGKDVEKDTPVVAPADKSEGTTQNPSTTAPSQTPSDKDDVETPSKKDDTTITETAEKEANNMVYYFLIPIAVLIAGCIGFIIKIKRRKDK